MKAYITKITFEKIEPTVWRRVILPAGATFHRLHETIQYVTNFQSEMEPYHYYSFNLEDLYVTNNEEILEMKEFMGRKVKYPSRLKIDGYLEEYGELRYNYDFGDDWNIQVTLEETVDDYYFGFPTILAEEGMAPPEDVGGAPGYAYFLKVYHDPTHPKYFSMRTWAESMKYLPMDIEEINNRLKFVKYKKTEWEYIHHDKYTLISDKYRGSDLVDLEMLPNKEIIIDYIVACVNLYGVIPFHKFLEIYNSQNKPAITSKELHVIINDTHYVKTLIEQFVVIRYGRFVNDIFEDFDDEGDLFKLSKGKPFYVPEKEELLRYKDQFHYEETSYNLQLLNMLAKDYFSGNKNLAEEEVVELVGQLQMLNANFNEVVKDFVTRFEFDHLHEVNEYIQVITNIANTTRLWGNRGHTPRELSQMTMPKQSPQLTVISGGKIGRNDLCPCGSGKKYKKCCGK